MMSCTSWVGPDPQFTCELGRPSVGWLVVPFRDVSSHKVLWSCTSDALHVGLICPSHFIECLTLNFRTRYRRVVIARSSCCMGLFVILTSLVVVLFLVTGSKFHIHIWVWSKRRLRTDSVLGGERDVLCVKDIVETAASDHHHNNSSFYIIYLLGVRREDRSKICELVNVLQFFFFTHDGWTLFLLFFQFLFAYGLISKFVLEVLGLFRVQLVRFGDVNTHPSHRHTWW